MQKKIVNELIKSYLHNNFTDIGKVLVFTFKLEGTYDSCISIYC